MGINFLHRAANVFLSINPPADRRIQKEILDMAQKGRQALLQLELIVFINFSSIQIDDFLGFWIETMCVMEGLNEQVTQADAVLQLCLAQNTLQ